MNWLPVPVNDTRMLVEQRAEMAPRDDLVREMLAIVRRRQKLFAAVFAVVLVAGLAWALTRPSIYEAGAMILLPAREPAGIVAEPAQGVAPPDSGYVASQVEILRSPALAEALVDRLHLQTDPEFGGTHAAKASVVERVTRSIEPRRRGSTYVVEVAVRSRDGEKAAQMSNALVQIYLTERVKARVESAEGERKWLAERLGGLSVALQQREAALETYRAQAGLLTVDGVSLTEQRLKEAETTVLAARMDMAERQARWRQAQILVRGGQSADSMSGALTSEVMTQLRAREADVDRRLAEYASRYGARHPTVVSAQAEREDIQRQLAAEVGRLTDSLRNDAEVSRARSGALEAHVSAVRAELVRNNGGLAHLNALERDVAGARTIYTAFQRRYDELANGAAGVGGDAQIIAAAAPSGRPASKPRWLLAGLALALASLAAAFAALIADKTSIQIETPEELERRFGLPVLTTIPRLRRASFTELTPGERHPGGYVVARPRSAFAESLRVLRARILRTRREKKLNVRAITSALPGEGKTTTSLALARVVAMSGKRVALVDCDLRGHTLNVLLGIEPERGILQVLRGEASWRDVIGIDEQSGAHVLPAAGDCFTAEDVFCTGRMHDLLQELASQYDLVVLDCPPVLTLAEARDLAVLADGVVLVARRGRSSNLAIRTAISELQAVDANIIGSVLNDVDENAPGRSTYSDPLYFNHAQRGMYAA